MYAVNGESKTVTQQMQFFAGGSRPANSYWTIREDHYGDLCFFFEIGGTCN